MQGPAADIKAVYRRFRGRQLAITFIAYGVYYFVRKNLSVLMPLMEKDLHIKKSELGAFLTAHDVLYGTSKFANGYLGDRSNARTFLAFGLLVSGLLNLAFGFSGTVMIMGLLWCANGWFQGIGFPPCARVLSHWFAPSERGTMWGIWNASHMVGAAGILVWGGWLGQTYGWRWGFFGPALVAIATSLFILLTLKDTPSELGLPPVEQQFGEYADAARPVETPKQDDAEFKAFLKRRVFQNPYIWLICGANFFVYVVRISFLNWAPTYLHETKGYSLAAAGGLTASYEIAGLVGSIIAGILTDKFFRNRRAPMCVIYMLGTAVAIYVFQKAPTDSATFEGIALGAVGFLIYGPQFLVGVMTADIVSKRAAATAIGLTGFFGYLSGVLSGYGLGRILELQGWDGGFNMLIASSLAAAVCFACCWKAGAPEEDLVPSAGPTKL
jgi:OPA family glycerol-3-phosphate transporter-like MFS transporter/OPA family sugar phosphate sensor protein UhpC-like MFS transporter